MQNPHVSLFHLSWYLPLHKEGEEFMSQEIICDTFSTTASYGKATVTQRSTKNLFERQCKNSENKGNNYSRNNANLSVSRPQTLML